MKDNNNWFFQNISKEKSFPEDFEDENGNYTNKCIICNDMFIGHKYRRVCKLCMHENILD